MQNISSSQIKKKLGEVLDPELGISIVDLGLIYQIQVKDAKVKILMTLTTIGCPLYSLIEEDIKNKMKELGFADDGIKLTLTFEPPWTMEKMSKKGKKILGI